MRTRQTLVGAGEVAADLRQLVGLQPGAVVGDRDEAQSSSIAVRTSMAFEPPNFTAFDRI